MLDLAIFVVAILVVVAVVLLAIGLASPRVLGRVIPWVRRPSPSRKRVALALVPALVVVLVAEGVLVSLPRFKVTLAAGNKVVAGESTGLKIDLANTGLATGTYSAVYALDGLKQSEVTARVGGGEKYEMSVPLPAALAPGRHKVAVGVAQFDVVALKPAAFSVTSFTTDTSLAATGQNIAVTAEVTNTGEAPGEFAGELFVDGSRYDARPATLGAGKHQQFVFAFTSQAQGTHSLRMGDATQSVVVVRPVRYANGRYLRRKAAGGHGILQIKNGNNLDGVVVLTRSIAFKVPVIACYVRANSSFTVTSIPDGTYWIYYSLGSDWNTYTKGFLVCTQRSRFSTAMKFTTSKWTSSWTTSAYRYTQGHVRYTQWRITLNPVAGGNAQTAEIDPSAFPQVH